MDNKNKTKVEIETSLLNELIKLKQVGDTYSDVIRRLLKGNCVSQGNANTHSGSNIGVPIGGTKDSTREEVKEQLDKDYAKGHGGEDA